jgi:hypothetical protein
MATNSATVGGGGGIAVSDEAMRQMGDVLPHVERGILRIYLQKYLDPMRAIGYVFTCGLEMSLQADGTVRILKMRSGGQYCDNASFYLIIITWHPSFF